MMMSWFPRLHSWPRGLDAPSRGGLARATGSSFLVIEADGDSFRVANARRRGGEVELRAAGAPDGFDELDALLARCVRLRSNAPPTAVLVTSEARPELMQGSQGNAHAIASAWQPRLSAFGIALRRIYPLVGAPLLALARAPREPLIYLQIERSLVAVMELVRGRTMELAVHAVEEPTAQRCRELVGEDCPEVLLSGGGGDLSAIGYELARAGTTWVRILRPCGSAIGAQPSALAALFGAARHACGLECFVPSAPPEVDL